MNEAARAQRGRGKARGSLLSAQRQQRAKTRSKEQWLVGWLVGIGAMSELRASELGDSGPTLIAQSDAELAKV
jgi:hypothetical protein